MGYTICMKCERMKPKKYEYNEVVINLIIINSSDQYNNVCIRSMIFYIYL